LRLFAAEADSLDSIAFTIFAGVETWIELGYWGLFIASFLAATVLPFSSEGVLVALLLAEFDPVLCIVLASLGNWLGGLTSYFLGYLGKWEWLERYFKMKPDRVRKWKVKADRFGAWLALLCWLPIVGDVVAIALGVFRVNAFRVAVLMFLGKFLRYLVVLYITLEASA